MKERFLQIDGFEFERSFLFFVVAENREDWENWRSY